MEERYIVKPTINTETGSKRDGVMTSHAVARGFQIYDTAENKRHSDSYMTRAEAQDECNRRNGR